MPGWKLCPLVYLLIGFILIPVFYFTFPALNLILFPLNLTGLAAAAFGAWLVRQTFRLMKMNQTPHNYERSIHVIVEGPFRYTRNPMYLGMALLLAGQALLFGNLASLAAPLLFCLIMNAVFIPFEEKKMENELGQDYLEYKTRVRRWV